MTNLISQKLAIYEDFFKHSANDNFWQNLHKYGDLSIEFVSMHIDKIPNKYWKVMSKRIGENSINSEFIFSFSTLFDWNLATKEFVSQKETDYTIFELYKDFWNWETISKLKNIPETYIERYKDKFNWEKLSMHSKMSENFIRNHLMYVDWTKISEWQVLSEDFIREFSNKVDWFKISKHQVLSEDFIREFADKVDWETICKQQKLSIPFMEEFSASLNYRKISRYQVLNTEFILQHLNELDINNLVNYQNLPEDFINEYLKDRMKKYSKTKKIKTKGKGVKEFQRKRAAKVIVEDEKRKERGFTGHSENYKYSKRPSGKPILKNEDQIRQEKSIKNRSVGKTWKD